MAKDIKPPPLPSSLKVSWKDVQAEANGTPGIFAVVLIVAFCLLVFTLMQMAGSKLG